MTQLLRKQKNGDIQTNKKAQMNTKHKPRLKTQKTLVPTGLHELVLVAVHMENFQCTA